MTAPQNILINGDFQCWQRGTSFTNMKNADYFADMWRIFSIGVTGSVDIEKTDNGFRIGADGGAGYLGEVVVYQVLSDELLKSLKGKKITLSYMQKTSSSKVEFKNKTVTVPDSVPDSVVWCLNNIGIRLPSAYELFYARLDEGEIAYKHQKEDYATALMRGMEYVEYGEFACQYNNTTYFISGFTYKFPKKSTPQILFVKDVLDESGKVNGTFESMSQNTWSAPFIRYNGSSAVGLGNKTLNVRVLITCEPL